jgi:hypothetical protein
MPAAGGKNKNKSSCQEKQQGHDHLCGLAAHHHQQQQEERQHGESSQHVTIDNHSNLFVMMMTRICNKQQNLMMIQQ